MNGHRLLLIALLLALCRWPAAAQPPAEGVLRYWDFEENTGSWSSLNPQAVLGLTATRENVLAGTSALELQYLFQPGGSREAQVAGNTLVALPGGVPGLASISLGIKTSDTTTCVVGLMEAPGGAYLAPVFCPAGVWQRVHVALADFVPVEELPDPDGRLDPAQVSACGLFDASGFLAGLGQTLPFAGFQPGQRRLWVDEVRLLSTDLPAETVALPPDSPPAVVIDSCERETIRFVVLGGQDWKATREAQAEAGPGHYRFEYTLPGGTLVALLRFVPQGHLAQTSALHFSARCDRSLRLVVSVEEKDKSRYTAQVDLRAEEDWKRFDLPWDKFTREQDSVDENDRLDPEQITLVSFADLSGLFSLENRKTVLLLDDLYATR
jgi:hypothetical protein